MIPDSVNARGICTCGNAGIVTSSRDRTVRFWTLDGSQKRDYTMSKILLGHTSFVGPLAWFPPNVEFPEGGIISGGMESGHWRESADIVGSYCIGCFRYSIGVCRLFY